MTYEVILLSCIILVHHVEIFSCHSNYAHILINNDFLIVMLYKIRPVSSGRIHTKYVPSDLINFCNALEKAYSTLVDGNNAK